MSQVLRLHTQGGHAGPLLGLLCEVLTQSPSLEQASWATRGSVHGSAHFIVFFPHIQGEFAVSPSGRNTRFLSTLTRESVTPICCSEITLPQQIYNS